MKLPQLPLGHLFAETFGPSSLQKMTTFCGSRLSAGDQCVWEMPQDKTPPNVQKGDLLALI